MQRKPKRRGMWVDAAGRLRDQAGKPIKADTRYRKAILRRSRLSSGDARKPRRDEKPSGEFERFKLDNRDAIKSRREKIRAWKRANRDINMGFIPRPKADKEFTDKTLDGVLKAGRKQPKISRIGDMEEKADTRHYVFHFDPSRFKSHLRAWLKREAKRHGDNPTVFFRLTMKGRKKDGSIVEVMRATGARVKLDPSNYSSILASIADLFLARYDSEIEFFQISDIQGVVIAKKRAKHVKKTTKRKAKKNANRRKKKSSRRH